MSSFICSSCGAYISDSYNGYLTGCEHYPLPKLSKPMDEGRTRELMLLIEQSIGYEFRVKGSTLTDIIEGVDWKYKHVCGEKYGNFHVDLIELTGNKAKK